MKKIVFFMEISVSHITPVLSLIQAVLKKGHQVHCFSSERHRKLFSSLNVQFHAYPDDFFCADEEAEQNYNSLARELASLSVNGVEDIKDALLPLLRVNISRLYKHKAEEARYLLEKVLQITPDLIFRDACDTLGKEIGKLLQIKTVGYITNNMYSRSLMDAEPEKYYPYITGTDYIKGLFTDKERHEYIEQMDRFSLVVAREKNTFPISLFHSYDPDDNHNIIFSTDFLQPCVPVSEKYYLTLPPDPISLALEEGNVDDELERFVTTRSNRLVYIATGSFVAEEDDFYVNLIKAFQRTDYKLVISWNKPVAMQKEILGSLYENENLLVRSSVPQKYILKHANLFIFHGGFNSIIEAVYHEVPMVIKPSTLEQTLNGLRIEELGIGLTTRKMRGDGYLTTGQMIIDALENPVYKQNLQRYAQELRHSDFEEKCESLFLALGC